MFLTFLLVPQSFRKIICTHFLFLKFYYAQLSSKFHFSEGNLTLMHINFLCSTEIIVTQFTYIYMYMFLLIQWQIQSTNANILSKIDLISYITCINKTCTCIFKTLSNFLHKRKLNYINLHFKKNLILDLVRW